MRKNLIAMSAVAALGTFGLVGGAAAQMAVNNGGTGHQLVFPYFSSQGDNATSIALVNTDTTNGKVVKVRFRSAVNSDDVLDFQVLMSPADVWTAAITQIADGDDKGKSRLVTADKSCTVPISVRDNGPKGTGTVFDTTRVDSAKDAAGKAALTREGYIEIINMADIPEGSALFTAVKHVGGKAPCTEAAFVSALTSPTQSETANLKFPTGRIAGDYIILQQTMRAAWSGSATALTLTQGDGTPTDKVVFWPQSDTPIASGTVGADGDMTTDPLMRTLPVAPATLPAGAIQLRSYDLPDLSTPYGVGVTRSGDQLASTMSALRTGVNMNQFETSPGIGGLTDLVLTQPTRRYMVAVNYSSGTGAYSDSGVISAFRNPLVKDVNTKLLDRVICLNKAKLGDVPVAAAASTKTGQLFDREENTPVTPPVYFSVSPSLVTPTEYLLCGEVSVTSINGTKDGATALNASLTRQIATFPYDNGWVMLDTTAYANGSGTGLPFINNAFVRASAPGQNFGFTFGNKYRNGR